MPYGLSKFCRFAVNVWEVNPAGKADEQVAREGLSCMEVWMKELGLTMNLHELGATEEMLHGIANGTIIMEGESTRKRDAGTAAETKSVPSEAEALRA